MQAVHPCITDVLNVMPECWCCLHYIWVS